MKVYLEFKDDKSEKFWEISLDGHTHTVRYGKVGTNGTINTKEFDTQEQAENDANKLINAKKKKGYIEAEHIEVSCQNSAITVNPEPQLMTYEDWKNKGNYFSVDDISSVIYFKGDLHIGEDFDYQWGNNLFKNLKGDYKGLIHIDGNLTVDGDISPGFDCNLINLFVSGDVTCDVLISGDEVIEINGDAYIKHVLVGDYNDGRIEISGITYVPYVLNNDHNTCINKDEDTLTLCYSDDDDQMLEYDFLIHPTGGTPSDILNKPVLEADGTFCYHRFINFIKKGQNPIKKKARTKKMIINDLVSKKINKAQKSKILDLSSCDLDFLPKKVLEFKELKKLDLSGNPLTILPEDLGKLENLEELDLAFTNVQTLPESIGNISTLRVLKLGKNYASLPESFGNLVNLEELSLLCNMDHFPKSFGNLQNLHYLSISPSYSYAFDSDETEYIFSDFPIEITKLKNLKTLTIKDCPFENFPASFNNLSNLETIYYIGNSDFELYKKYNKSGFKFTTLNGLPKLNKIHFTKIQDAPFLPLFYNLESIESIGLHECVDLKQNIFKNIHKTKRLKELYITSCELSYIHEDIYKIEDLQYLWLSKNKNIDLTSYKKINQIKSLKGLYLRDCNLNSLDPTIFKIDNLGHMSLSDNDLDYNYLTTIQNAHPNASISSNLVLAPGQEEELNYITELRTKVIKLYYKLDQTEDIEDKLTLLKEFHLLADHIFEELAPEGTKFYSYNEYCDKIKSLIVTTGNELAWRSYLHDDDPSKLEKSIRYLERALKLINETEQDNIRDTYVRILIKTGRIEDAYKIIFSVLNRNKDFSDFQDFYNNEHYISWVKNQQH